MFFLGLGILFFSIPYLAWKIYNVKNFEKPVHPLKNILLILNYMLMIFVWSVSGLYSYVFMIAFNPWPLSAYQHYAVKNHLLETGVIPQNAKNIYVRDSHAGFHGDGNRFVTFIYTGNVRDVPEVKKINAFIKYNREKPTPHISVQMNWKKSPPGLFYGSTVSIVTSDFGIQEEYLPNTESSTLYYYCTDDLKSKGLYCRKLHIYDSAENKYWYFNVTT